MTANDVTNDLYKSNRDKKKDVPFFFLLSFFFFKVEFYSHYYRTIDKITRKLTHKRQIPNLKF